MLAWRFRQTQGEFWGICNRPINLFYREIRPSHRYTRAAPKQLALQIQGPATPQTAEPLADFGVDPAARDRVASRFGRYGWLGTNARPVEWAKSIKEVVS
jgi:hypothetical protein